MMIVTLNGIQWRLMGILHNDRNELNILRLNAKEAFHIGQSRYSGWLDFNRTDDHTTWVLAHGEGSVSNKIAWAGNNIKPAKGYSYAPKQDELGFIGQIEVELNALLAQQPDILTNELNICLKIEILQDIQHEQRQIELNMRDIERHFQQITELREENAASEKAIAAWRDALRILDNEMSGDTQPIEIDNDLIHGL